MPANEPLPSVGGRVPRLIQNLGDWFIVDASDHQWELCRDGVWRNDVRYGSDEWPDEASAEAFLRSLSPPAEIPCPECHGSGESGLVPVCLRPVEGHSPTVERLQELARVFAVCSFCGGKKTVAPERLEWRAIDRLLAENEQLRRVIADAHQCLTQMSVPDFPGVSNRLERRLHAFCQISAAAHMREAALRKTYKIDLTANPLDGMTEHALPFDGKPFPPSDPYSFEAWAREVEQRIVNLEAK